MKTIDINLLGSVSETHKSVYKPIKIEEKVDDNIKNLSKILVLSSSVIFLGCFCIWGYNVIQTNSMTIEISKIKAERILKEKEYKDLDQLGKVLVKERKILESKYKFQKLIEKEFLPWSKVLSNLTRAIPKSLVIDEIKKREMRNKNGLMYKELAIKGKINQSKSPLQSLSFFLLNINENYKEDTTLTNARAEKVEFEEKEGLYKFEVSTEIKVKEEIKEKTKVNS